MLAGLAGRGFETEHENVGYVEKYCELDNMPIHAERNKPQMCK